MVNSKCRLSYFPTTFRPRKGPAGPLGCPRQWPEAIFATARSDARPIQKEPPFNGAGVSAPRGGSFAGQLCGRAAATQRRRPTALPLVGTSGRSEARASPTRVPRSHRQRGTKPPEAARTQAGRELLAEERRYKLPSPTDSPDSFAPSSCSALRGACSGPNLRSRMHPSAVSPREELCSRQQRRPPRRHLDRRRRGEKKSLPRRRHRQRPEAAPTRKGRHFVAQQRRRKLSSPTVGPDSLCPCFWSVLRGGACLGANQRSYTRPTAVSPRAELCSRRQCRPGRRQLDGRRHGENNAVARGRLRQRPKKGRPQKWRHLMAQKRVPKR